MIVSEMHTAFNVEMDKNPISGYPSFLPEEIDYWLNKAYLEIVNQKFTGNNALKGGFESSQKRISDLSALIKTATNASVPCTSSPTSCQKANDFLFFVEGDLIHKTAASGAGTVRSSIIPITHEDAWRFKKTASNNPVIINPAMVQEGSNMVVYYDESTVLPVATTNMSMTYKYICTPEKLSYSSPNASPSIAAHTHQEIVALAVYLALENIESQRVQTNSFNLNIQE